MNRKRVDICPGEEERIGFALYTDEDVEGAGAIALWADGELDTRFPREKTGITRTNNTLGAMRESFLERNVADPFREDDIEALKILKYRLKIEEEYEKELKQRDPRNIFRH